MLMYLFCWRYTETAGTIPVHTLLQESTTWWICNPTNVPKATTVSIRSEQLLITSAGLQKSGYSFTSADSNWHQQSAELFSPIMNWFRTNPPHHLIGHRLFPPCKAGHLCWYWNSNKIYKAFSTGSFFDGRALLSRLHRNKQVGLQAVASRWNLAMFHRESSNNAFRPHAAVPIRK